MNRKKATKELYRVLDKLTGTKDNSNMYKVFLDVMSDKQFSAWLQDCVDGKKKIYIVVPNYSKIDIDTRTIFEVADEIGLNMYQYVVYDENKKGIPKYRSRYPLLILYMMVRRASQMQAKKVAISESEDNIDVATGQLSSANKASAISATEAKLLASLGNEETNLDASLTELLKFRGGDLGAYNAFRGLLEAYGEVSMDEISPHATGVESKSYIRSIFACQHFKLDI